MKALTKKELKNAEKQAAQLGIENVQDFLNLRFSELLRLLEEKGLVLKLRNTVKPKKTLKK